MHIKKSFDEMLKAKETADKVLSEYLIGQARAGVLDPKDCKKLLEDWRQLTNDIVKPFTE